MHSKKYTVTEVYYESDDNVNSRTAALDVKSSKQLTPGGNSFLSAKWDTFLPWLCCVLLGLCALVFILSIWLVGRASFLGQSSVSKDTLKIGQTGHFRNHPYPAARNMGKLVVYPHQESRGDKSSSNRYIISLDKERNIKENVENMRRILNDYPEQGARHGAHPGSPVSETTAVSDNCTTLKNYGYDINGDVISPCIVLGFEKEKGSGIPYDATTRETILFANITCKAKNHFDKKKFRKLEIYRRTGFPTKTTTGKYLSFLVMVQLIELQRGSNVTMNCWVQNTPKNILTNENKVEIFFSFHGTSNLRPTMSESTIYHYESTGQKTKTTLSNTVGWIFNKTTIAVIPTTITTDYSHQSNQTEILTLGKLTTDQNLLLNQTTKQSTDVTTSTKWTSDHTTETVREVLVNATTNGRFHQPSDTVPNINTSTNWTYDHTTETITDVNVSTNWTSDYTTETVRGVLMNATTSGRFDQTSDILPDINTSTYWTSDHTTETGKDVNVTTSWSSDEATETASDVNVSTNWISDQTTETVADVNTTEKKKTGIEFDSTFNSITTLSTNSETPIINNATNTVTSATISRLSQSTSPSTAGVANDDIFGGFNHVH
ncbi:uncharacterized protein LOC106457258 isoform X2 [Limulus polyphemus]|uniref:Uncharacterized protein LOC106457258 isoform X2 n=1 Tax=Limulus polyphemus TaxID=6850 RepID=A0ABM1S597_LIMPO|nr:uncharacterized protein LOC106457258 isoform X2 [Limulus polyphemus]